MSPRIALLRAVNVGGRTTPMAELRALFETEGLTAVRTLLQSGNLVFEGGGDDVEARLEAAIHARFGFAADVMVRDRAQWAAAIAANPFKEAAAHDPAHLLLMPLKAEPSPDAAAALAAWAGPEQGVVVGREAYLVYPEGIGRSKLTIAVIERTLKTRGTGRNWNTVLKLQEMLG